MALSGRNKRAARDTPADRLTGLHFGLCLHVRNMCGLWAGSDELIRACARAGHPEEEWLPYLPVHPDEASAVVVGEVWRTLNA